MIFCRDADLLYWEPDVLKDAAFASQTLGTGTGDVAGTTLTRTAGTAFDSVGIEPGQVIVLSGSAAGRYVITAVGGAATLTLSTLYDELFPAADAAAPDPAPVGTATGVTFTIRTFYAQRYVVSDFLTRAVGIVPNTADGEAASILNPDALRRACALGTLQMIYSAIAAVADEPATYSLRADLYERLYRRSLRSAQVDVDLDGDGRADARRSPGLLRMART